MDESIGKLTVYFDDPFWVGVFEHIEDEKLSVCKITFGAEPKDYEILEFVLKYYSQLKFSPAVDVTVRKETTNPKRIQREARKQTAEYGMSSQFHKELAIMFDDPFERAEEETVPAHPLVLLRLPEGCLYRCVATGENEILQILPVSEQSSCK